MRGKYKLAISSRATPGTLGSPGRARGRACRHPPGAQSVVTLDPVTLRRSDVGGILDHEGEWLNPAPIRCPRKRKHLDGGGLAKGPSPGDGQDAAGGRAVAHTAAAQQQSPTNPTRAPRFMGDAAVGDIGDSKCCGGREVAQITREAYMGDSGGGSRAVGGGGSRPPRVGGYAGIQ